MHDSAYSDKHHFRTISGLAIKVIGNGKLYSGLVLVQLFLLSKNVARVIVPVYMKSFICFFLWLLLFFFVVVVEVGEAVLRLKQLRLGLRLIVRT